MLRASDDASFRLAVSTVYRNIFQPTGVNRPSSIPALFDRFKLCGFTFSRDFPPCYGLIPYFYSRDELTWTPRGSFHVHIHGEFYEVSTVNVSTRNTIPSDLDRSIRSRAFFCSWYLQKSPQTAELSRDALNDAQAFTKAIRSRSRTKLYRYVLPRQFIHVVHRTEKTKAYA